MTYKEKLLSPKWQKKRLHILERDNWTCQLCGDQDTTLEIHHFKYSGNPWDVDDGFLVTYCKHCHGAVELINKSYDKISIISCIKSIDYDNIKLSMIMQNDDNLFAVLLVTYDSSTNKHELLCAIKPVFFRNIVSKLDEIKKRIS